MSLRRATPFPFTPVGLSDTFDGSNVMKGAMAALQNLIPVPGTRNLWQCRPASIELADFTTSGGGFSSGFSSGFQIGMTGPVGAISCLKVIGDIVYGLIATGLNAGRDQPFAYNLLTDTLVSVTGMTAANTPLSPAASGAWTPPTMDLIGVKLVVTHPGFTGAGNVYFGYFDITTPTAPVWYGANTTGAVTFTTVPTAVKQFGGRAYYAINPAAGQPSLVASDALAATVVTNAGQVLTFGDNQQLTALGGLPLDNQLGGQLQSLIVFKSAANMFQVTGDYSTPGWSINSLNVATGTLSPLSVCPTSKGLAFVSPDGLRIIDYMAHVSEPLGDAGDGITTAFIYAGTPSRTVAAANANVIRISLTNDYATGSPVQEMWFHFNRRCWSGPHTFPATAIQPYNNTFVMAAYGVDALLFQSDAVQSSISTFVENSNQMTFAWQTSMLPDTQQMCENNILETTINMSLAASVDIGVSALDQNGAVLGSVTISPTGGATQWGNFQWGQAQWLGASNALYPRELQWTQPIVFRRLAMLATGDCASGVMIGDMFLRYEQLGYLQQSAA